MENDKVTKLAEMFKQSLNLLAKAADKMDEDAETIKEATATPENPSAAAIEAHGEDVINHLIDSGYIPAEKRAAAMDALSDPGKVIEQLKLVLEHTKVASVGKSAALTNDDDAPEDPVEANNVRYLTGLGVR